MEDVFEINRRNWEDRVAIHLRDTTGFYNIKGFLAGGAFWSRHPLYGIQ